jgi:MFS family permease
MLINRIGGFVLPFLALYLAKGRGMSVEAAGAIASLYGAGMMVAGLGGGILADRLGRRTVMLISLLGGPPLMLALGLVHSIAAIAVLTLLVGAVYELYRPAVSAMIADLVEQPSQRLRAFGLLYWAVNVGAGVAPVLGGYLARRSYVWLFAADAVTTFLFGLIVFVRIAETRPAVPPETRAARAGLGPVLADRVFLAFCFLTFMTALLYHQGWVALSLDLVGKGFSEATFGQVIAVNGFLIILLQPLAGPILARFDRGRVLAASSVAVAIGLGMNAVVDRAWLYGLAVAVWTLGEIAAAPTSSSIVADLAPADLRGRYQGMSTVSWSTSGMLAPTLGAAVLGRSSTLLWASCAIVAMGLVAAYLIFGGALRRRTATPPG